MIAYQVQSSLSVGYQRGKPVRSPKYLAFIRRQASVVSGRGGCDPCHTGPHGAGQKSSDLSAIPLTRKEHDEFDADPDGFAARHGLNIPQLIADLNRIFELDPKGGTYA